MFCQYSVFTRIKIDQKNSSNDFTAQYRPKPAPSSQSILFEILLLRTLKPRKHRFFARTSAIKNRVRTKLTVYKYGCFHFSASLIESRFMKILASRPSIPLQNTTKGQKCFLCSKQAFKYFFSCLCAFKYCIWLPYLIGRLIYITVSKSMIKSVLF